MAQSLPRMAVVALILALAEGGYMLVDGLRRLVVGDFIRIGGQLGPWSLVVGAVGIDPLAMGPVFLVLGIAQVAAALSLLLRFPRGDSLLLAFAVGTSWYLVFGTVSSVVQIALILVTRRRRASRRSTAH